MCCGCPTSAEFVVEPELFRTLVLERLRLPLVSSVSVVLPWTAEVAQGSLPPNQIAHTCSGSGGHWRGYAEKPVPQCVKMSSCGT